MDQETRASRAQEALNEYLRAKGEPADNLRSDVIDLMSDLQHLCEHHGEDTEGLTVMAAIHFDEERPPE